MAKIQHSVTINCNPSKVYNALTTREGIQGWWTPDVKIEPIKGSIAEFIFKNRYHNKMKIIALQPNRRIEWQCLEGDVEWIGTHLIFATKKIDNKTLLQFEQNNWRAKTEFYHYCHARWKNYLISLKQFCETGKGMPFSLEK